jgi:hypothetical protein
MLSLLDPVQIDNLSLFRDDEDPRKFYVLPDEPVVSTDDQGNPDFYFIHYIRDVANAADTATNDDLAGGYVQFRTALKLSDARRATVLAALKTQLAQEQQAGKKPLGNAITSTDPLLANPLWTKGTVHLETFKVGDKELVRQATDAVPVDLAGSLGAAMTLTLSSDGAEVFWASFKSFKDLQIPIVIRYDLSYQARVAANMTIHADRKTVISQVWKLAQPVPMRFVPANRRWAKVPFTGPFTPASLQKMQLVDPTVAAVARWSDVRAAIHSSVTSGDIEVKVDIGEGAGGTDNKVQAMLFTLATDLLTNKVVPTVFGDPVDDGSTAGSSSSSSSADPNKPDDALLKMPPMDSTNTTENTFDMSFTSTDVIEQTCSPNAPIHLLIDDPAKLDACFKELRITDGFFSLMRVATSTAGVNFAQDGLNTVHVYLDYDEVDEGSPDKPRVHRSTDFALKSETDVVRWKFDTARDAAGAHKTHYKFRTDVYYGDVVVRSKPTDWIPATDQMLEVTPAHMGVVRVQLQYTARRDQVQSARVRLTATNRAGEQFVDTFELSPEAATKTWLRPTGDLATSQLRAVPQQYTHQITYIVNGNEIAMPEETSSSDGLSISGPFTKQLQYTLLPQGSFDGVSSISGTATYTDPSTGYTVMKPYQLTSLSSSIPFVVPAMPGGPDTITVTGTINKADGSATPLDPITASQGEVRIGLGVTSFLEITVNASLLDFDKDVQLALVQLAYAGSAQGDVATTLTFNKAASGPQTWKVPLRANGTLDYDLDVQYVAYDRTKNSEVHDHPHANKSAKTVLLLDRSAK